ncbi:hypothetical protein HDU98_002428 [Podochytrium sp. JEL0797]|nr:hypothetical protein HDU98_002428 [Podochytrium sp. JEL0797]
MEISASPPGEPPNAPTTNATNAPNASNGFFSLRFFGFPSTQPDTTPAPPPTHLTIDSSPTEPVAIPPSTTHLSILHTPLSSVLLVPPTDPLAISTLSATDHALTPPNATDLPLSPLGQLIISALETPAESPDAQDAKSLLFSHMTFSRNALTSLDTCVLPMLLNLTFLDLSENELTVFPTDLCACLNLVTLCLDYNHLSVFSVKPRTSSDRTHPIFTSLLRLSLSHNAIESVVSEGLKDSFPVLESIDFSHNNLLDVFEMKELTVLEALGELGVVGNPIVQNTSYRLNIFTYFKSRALTLKIDNTLPSASEKKEILAGLTIAATTSTASAPSLIAAALHPPPRKPKRKPRRAIAVVEPVSIVASPAEFDQQPASNGAAANVILASTPPPPPVATFATTRGAAAAPAPTVYAFTGTTSSATTSPARGAGALLVQTNTAGGGGAGGDGLDLTMESMDSEHSCTPSSTRALSPLHGVSVFPSEESAAGVAAAAAVGGDEEQQRRWSRVVEEDAEAVEVEVLEAPLPPPVRDERKISKYFDAQQEFLSSTTATNSSVSSGDEEEEGVSHVGASGMRGGVSRLDRIEQSVAVAAAAAAASSSLGAGRRGPSQVEDSTFMKRRAGGGGVSAGVGVGVGGAGGSQKAKPNFPNKMSSLSNRFETIEPISSCPSSPEHTATFSTLSYNSTTPLATTPRNPAPTTPTTALKHKQTKQTAWHARMSQISDLARREAQQLAQAQEDAEIAAGTGLGVDKNVAGFDAALGGVGDVHHLPPQRPLREVEGSIHSGGGSSGGAVAAAGDSIGPYRRVYEFEAAGGDVESVRSRGVHVLYKEEGVGRGVGGASVGGRVGVRGVSMGSVGGGGGAYRSMSNDVRFPRRFEGYTVGAIAEEGGGGAAGGEMMAPRLVLARPVVSYSSGVAARRFREDSSDVGSERGGGGGGGSVYSAAVMGSRNGGRGMSVFSGESGGFSVFSGMTGASAAPSLYNAHRPLPHHSLLFPRAPNIPFVHINNSLQLHLKFKVLANDQEQILAWVAGSVVPQVSPYIQGIAAQHSKKVGGSFLGSLLGGATSGGSGPREDAVVAETVERMQTVERAAYLLVTDKALYVFTPTFAMPYDPFSKGHSGSGGPQAASTSVKMHVSDPAEAFRLSNVIAQVRYDDPTKVLKLARRVSLTHVGRVDVGPNRQFLGIHFVVGEDDKASGGGGGAGVRRVSGIGVEGSLKSGGGSAGRKEVVSLGQNPLSGVRSLVFLSRDRVATGRVLDALVPVLYEQRAGKKGKVVNQDVEWSLVALREKVLLKSGGGDVKDIVWNQMRVWGNLGWQDVVARKKAAERGGEKKSWLSGLLSTQFSTGGGPPVVPVEARPLEAEANPRVIGEADCDSATGSHVVLNKVNFEFLKLYLLVGWIVPHALPPPPPPSLKIRPSLTVTVNSTTLIATSEYMYLTNERFDVWPPPLFPTSTRPAASVNAPFLDHAAALFAASIPPPAQPSPSPTEPASPPLGPSPPDPLKGLSASQIPQYSPPLRVGRVRNLVRCERWKTWRWRLDAQVTHVEEASVMEQKVAALIQNGAVGVVRVVEDQWPIGGGSGTGVGEKGRRAGATVGWEWWVRVVFNSDSEEEGGESSAGVSPNSAELGREGSSATTGTPVTGEYFWDLVFATLDAANEFLEFVKLVRGVRPVYETEETGFDQQQQQQQQHQDGFSQEPVPDDGDRMVSSPTGQEFEEVDFARDSRFFDRVTWDGVALVIGDD